MADEPSGVVVEATASRAFVEKLLVDDETHIYSLHPAVVLAFVLEPVIPFAYEAFDEACSDVDCIGVTRRVDSFGSHFPVRN